ncbi:MAG TPA: hypothetical protein VNM48_01695, partial [Chloroflexota bacterium]|nr:hypothetical protein [Chloroflexota bacterium]
MAATVDRPHDTPPSPVTVRRAGRSGRGRRPADRTAPPPPPSLPATPGTSETTTLLIRPATTDQLTPAQEPADETVPLATAGQARPSRTRPSVVPDPARFVAGAAASLQELRLGSEHIQRLRRWVQTVPRPDGFRRLHHLRSLDTRDRAILFATLALGLLLLAVIVSRMVNQAREVPGVPQSVSMPVVTG